MNRDLAIACTVWMRPDLYHPLRKRGYEMSPGSKHSHHREVWAVRGKGAVVTLGVRRWMCPPWLALVPAEEGGEIFGVAMTLLRHLGLQNMQFLRGIKSTQKSKMVCSIEPCCPKKISI